MTVYLLMLYFQHPCGRPGELIGPPVHPPVFSTPEKCMQERAKALMQRDSVGVASYAEVDCISATADIETIR